MTLVTIMDGGVGQEIYRRSRLKEAPLWSVEVMLHEPEIVTQVHRDFITAGAQVLTLNTYTATPTRLSNSNRGSDFSKIHNMAEIAMARATAESPHPIKVAGCLPPLHGSYQKAPDRAPKSLRDEYRAITELHPDVDLWIIETMTNPVEAEAAVTAASKTGKPTFIAYRLEADGKLKSGHSLDAMRTEFDHSQLAGVLINCTEPEVITKHIHNLQNFNLPYGAYGNAFQGVKALAEGGSVSELKARDDLTPSRYADYADQWINTGATIVGGCCEITPTHIQELARRLKNLS